MQFCTHYMSDKSAIETSSSHRGSGGGESGGGGGGGATTPSFVLTESAASAFDEPGVNGSGQVEEEAQNAISLANCSENGPKLNQLNAISKHNSPMIFGRMHSEPERTMPMAEFRSLEPPSDQSMQPSYRSCPEIGPQITVRSYDDSENDFTVDEKDFLLGRDFCCHIRRRSHAACTYKPRSSTGAAGSYARK